MKNRHILSTDKPSRLYLGNNGNFVFGMMQTSIQSKNDDFTNQNIYITDNSEIKLGDYKYSVLQNNVEKVAEFSLRLNEEYWKLNNHIHKKIILTTDQDLIKDGVQAIEDEFLEWFVKNPSCESVKIIEIEDELISPKNPKIRFNALQDPPSFISAESLNNMIITYKYKIITPKKNFYCGDKFDYDEQCLEQCDTCVDKKGVDYGYLPKEEPKQCPIGGFAPGYYARNCITCKTHFFGDKRAVQCEPCAIKITKREEPNGCIGNNGPDDSGLNEIRLDIPKQETLEEVAERILANNIDGLRDALKDDDLFFFYKGVVQCYGEAMAKWQQKRMYSKENLKYAFEEGKYYNMLTFEKWFETFKKK
jgi:hypothetical protein